MMPGVDFGALGVRVVMVHPPLKSKCPFHGVLRHHGGDWFIVSESVKTQSLFGRR